MFNFVSPQPTVVIIAQMMRHLSITMEVDQLSEPVKTGFGWHLIKLHAIKGGETEPFETVILLKLPLPNIAKSKTDGTGFWQVTFSALPP